MYAASFVSPFGVLAIFMLATQKADFLTVLLFTLVAVGIGLWFSFVCAVIVRNIEVSIHFRDRDEFLERLRSTLAKFGYSPESESQSFLTFKGRFFRILPAAIAAHRISVQLQRSEARIVGPAWEVNELVRYLGDLTE